MSDKPAECPIKAALDAAEKILGSLELTRWSNEHEELKLSLRNAIPAARAELERLERVEAYVVVLIDFWDAQPRTSINTAVIHETVKKLRA